MQRIAVVLSFIAAACGGSTSSTPSSSSPRPTPTPAPTPAAPARDMSALAAAIETGILPPVQVKGDAAHTTLAELMAKHHVPAVSIAVFENYELVWAHAYGLADVSLKLPASESTVFQAGSISKSVNALAVLGAVADGTLALDRPINELLTSWKLPENELTKEAPVTIRRLLSHTAGTTVHGFPGYTAGTPVPTLPQLLDGTPPANTAPIRVDLKPGTRFRYSGGGTSITQLALVDKLGAPYPTILRDRVLAPLGMDASTYEQPLPRWRVARAAAGYRSDGSETPGKRNVYPEMAAAGLWTTPSDLARFLIEVARGRAGTSKVVTRDVALQMTTPETKAPDPLVGLGVFIADRNGTGTFGHGGADDGFQADALATLEGGNGVVIMCNSDNGFQIFPAIERTVFGVMKWKGADPVVERARLTEGERLRVAGRYMTVEYTAFTVAVAGDRLTITRPFGDPAELVPLGGDRFVSATDGTAYTFDPKGTFDIELPSNRMGLAVRLVPGASAPLFALEAGQFDAAVADWKKRIAKSKDLAQTLEDFHNLYGYQLLLDGKTDAAITIFRAIIAVYPESSNAQDSYGEALMKKGDTAGAIAAYEKAIALLGIDKRIPIAERPARREHAESQLAKLRDPR
ncbi:MAG TPA: serine hydrolase [Kofleriaceae bacterium]|nr:serine hydrolase [Kofleriaceae bacterium]